MLTHKMVKAGGVATGAMATAVVTRSLRRSREQLGLKQQETEETERESER